MDFAKMSTGGLRSMHDAVRRALEEDDRAPAEAKLYAVREYPDWKLWSDDLEAELKRRGEIVSAICWDNGNAQVKR